MESLGSYLKRERELRQISIAEVAQTTRIPGRILEDLESDRVEALPADVFVRGYLRAYARAVSLDEGDVLARYQSKPEPEAPAPLPAVYAPEPGRRFGIAIALVILLILFTLALSVVLRPRHRDAPIELSSRTPSAQTQINS
jgi:cytoskeletal protein RodZ